MPLIHNFILLAVVLILSFTGLCYFSFFKEANYSFVDDFRRVRLVYILGTYIFRAVISIFQAAHGESGSRTPGCIQPIREPDFSPGKTL